MNNKIKIEPIHAAGNTITHVVRPGKTIKIGAEIDSNDLALVKGLFKESTRKEKKTKEVHDAEPSDNS